MNSLSALLFAARDPARDCVLLRQAGLTGM